MSTLLLRLSLFSLAGLAANASDPASISTRPPPAAMTAAPLAADTAHHPLRGVVVEVHPDRGTVLVKHEAIPGFMGAMTMQFRAEPAALAPLHAGDRITAELVERGDDLWLEAIRVVTP